MLIEVLLSVAHKDIIQHVVMGSASSQMKDQTILFLTYYYQQADRNDPILQHIIGRYCSAYLPFDMYLYEPLRRIFGQVVLYDFLRRRAELGLRAMNEEVLALGREMRPRYVLWTSFYDDIRRSTLAEMQKMGSTTVGWFFDDEWRFGMYSKYWIPYLDYCVTNAISAVPAYRKLGARVIQTIPNTGIAVDVDWSRVQAERDISFIGSIRTADRRRYVHELGQNQIPVTVLGEGGGGYVSFERMLEIFRTSRINLNFSKVGDDRGHLQIKGRVFQVCMAGGFLLTEYAPGLEKYFELDKEIVSFENPQEMVEKVRYYLNHDRERRAIAQAGWERAHRDYSSSRMVAKVFEEIEEDLAAKVSDSAPHARGWMSVKARNVLSGYHLMWVRAGVEENDTRGLWMDDLVSALSYGPWHLWAWIYGVLAVLPWPARLSLFGTLRRLETRRFDLTVPLRWLASKWWAKRRLRVS